LGRASKNKFPERGKEKCTFVGAWGGWAQVRDGNGGVVVETLLGRVQGEMSEASSCHGRKKSSWGRKEAGQWSPKKNLHMDREILKEATVAE